LRDAFHGDHADTGADSSDATDSGEDACGVTASWNPSMLAKLGLWLNDDTGINVNGSGDLETWDDQSGHGNEASIVNAGQGVMTIDPGIVNGHDAVECPGNGMALSVLDAPSLQFGTSGFLIGVVVKTGVTDQVQVYEKGTSGSSGYSVVEDASGDYVFAIGTQSIKLTPTDHAHFHYLVAVSTTTGMQLQSDGVTTASGPASTLDVSDVGSLTYALDPLGAVSGNADELAEVVAAEGPVSCSDVANLVAYFTMKFGL
jgi:hypothetical protein